MSTKALFSGIPAIGLLGALLLPGAASGQEADAAREALVERGKYLVTVMDCTGCHTPPVYPQDGTVPVLDSTRFLSGYPGEVEPPDVPEGALGPDKWGGMFSSRGTAFAGAWGVSFPRNLTPDVETGLGSWTDEIFIKALRTGKDMGEGRDILPPMPWAQFRQATDEDLQAIFAYLQSIEPVYNAVPDPISPEGERLETLKPSQ